MKKEYIVDRKAFRIEKLKEDFGEFVLVIAHPEVFIDRIKKYCETSDIELCYREVTYVDYEDKDKKWKKEYKDNLSQFFIKDRNIFEEQKEFRLLLANVVTEEEKDYYSINIPGGFKDITRISPGYRNGA